MSRLNGTLPELKIDRSKAQPGPESYFVGNVHVQVVHRPAPGEGGFEVVAVFFDAGARNRPHTHTTDQLLYFVEGSGFVHVAGAEEQHAGPGTMMVVPAGVVHMHGATAKEPIVHIAMRPAGAGSRWDFDDLPDGWERWVAK
jgi:quercetin dioxygenase-like cupin family protein